MGKKKYIIILALFIFAWSFFLTYGYDKELPRMIRVGLSYGQNAPKMIKISSKNGFELGVYDEDEFIPLLNLMNNQELIIQIDSDIDKNMGYHHIQIGGDFYSLADALEYISKLKDIDIIAYPVYFNGWKVWTGLYTDEERAYLEINSLQAKTNSNDLKIISPNNQLVQILDSMNNTLFIYNPNNIEFFIREYFDKGSKSIININGQNFRGDLLIKRFNGMGLTLINHLSLQEYLYGVLPREMASDWPLEALKAQAVAARNFAVANINKHKEFGFDVCSGTDCQVYGGYDVESPRTNRAVDETEGRLLTYDGQLITAFYHSNSGGHTENSENVWNSYIPYIRGVKDDYSIGAPNTTWTKVYSPTEISAILKQNGYDIGTVLDVSPLEISENGRVQSLEIRGTKDRIILYKEQIRAIFGYNVVKSIWFTVETDGSIYVLSGEGNRIKKSVNDVYLVSAGGIIGKNLRENYTIYNGILNRSVKGYPTQFVFNGRGWGHGLGMSQWGAYQMAQMGYTYDEILRHYYVGAKLE